MGTSGAGETLEGTGSAGGHPAPAQSVKGPMPWILAHWATEQVVGLEQKPRRPVSEFTTPSAMIPPFESPHTC